MLPSPFPEPPVAKRQPGATPAELIGLRGSEVLARLGEPDSRQFYPRRPAPEDGWFGPGTGKIERGAPAMTWSYRCFGATYWTVWLGWEPGEMPVAPAPERLGFWRRAMVALGLEPAPVAPPSRPPSAEPVVRDVVLTPWNAVF